MTSMESRRLILRPFNLEDAPGVKELAGSIAIARTTLNVPHPYPEGAAEAWIAGHPAAAASGSAYIYAMVQKEGNILTGCISLNVRHEHRHAELGYWVGELYWNKGYASEAAECVLRFGFEQAGLHRIYASAMISNPASARVMEKCGMQQEGILRHHARGIEGFTDLVYYGILENEYRRTHNGAEPP